MSSTFINFEKIFVNPKKFGNLKGQKICVPKGTESIIDSFIKEKIDLNS